MQDAALGQTAELLLTEQQIIDSIRLIKEFPTSSSSVSKLAACSESMRYLVASTEVFAHEIAEQYESFGAYVALGNVKGLLRFACNDLPLIEPKSSDDPLLQGRLAMAFLSSGCICAARRGGLSASRAFAVTQRYADLANATQNARLAHYLIVPMMVELAEAVRQSGKMIAQSLSHRAIDYARSHLDTQLNGESVASALGVSRKTLCLRFRNETGETFAACVRNMRVERARRLLKTTDHDIARIAQQTGFSSQSHLQTVFKSLTGFTPREWRLHQL